MAIDEPVRDTAERSAVLLRRGRILESVTLGWDVAGIVILAIAAVSARSVALAGFGLDSLIEIGASTVVLWELSGTGEDWQQGLRLIGGAFVALSAYPDRPVHPGAGDRVNSLHDLAMLAGCVAVAGRVLGDHERRVTMARRSHYAESRLAGVMGWR